MSFITVGKENSGTTDLYYEDHGTGKPVVLIHSYLLSSTSWERQTAALLEAGYRVITYDRRGYGKSSQPATGYDYDTLAADLNTLVTTLDLRDFALVGYSMGGGEVARYLGTYGTSRVSHVAFISAVPPYLLKTDDNPEGVDGSVFAGLKQAIMADRPSFVSGILHEFYNLDVYGGTRVSDQTVQASFNVAVTASPVATLDCVDIWGTDFRADLARIDVPTLVIHGDADRIVPFPASGLRTHKLMRDSRLVVVEGGPHAILWTHPEVVNPALLDFLR